MVGVCAGAQVLANAGVLHDRRATTHWYRVAEMRKTDPSIHYVADRRYVAGRWSVQWDQRSGDGAAMPAVVYVYRMQAGAFSAERKMILMP